MRATYGYDDYPLLAKVVSQGIGLHEGRSLGLAEHGRLGAVLPRRHRDVRDRAADVVATSARGGAGWRPAGADAGAREHRRSRSVWSRSGCSSRCSGISLLVVLLLDRFVLRRVPALAELLRRGLTELRVRLGAVDGACLADR